MPQLKNYRIMISHSWNYSNQYNKVVSWLNNANYFSWFNHSVSCDNPLDVSSKSELKKRLTNKMIPCSAVVVVAGMYAAYSEWIDYEIDEAIRMGKPIIGIRPWGSERTPQKIVDNADVLVGWNAASVVTAIRQYSL